ncbi:hypothetical protein LTR36_004880 [Oleoguttula mirabilis]|uniref:Uncharacterized protein n=1 Tax=Oleoguttula mirabilis TaxID=1507867 RepID=A0AAV9JFL1_9PEZI|nr:hypothetical protein LTR36_004880 [Oleoguttula mirabilis]
MAHQPAYSPLAPSSSPPPARLAISATAYAKATVAGAGPAVQILDVESDLPQAQTKKLFLTIELPPQYICSGWFIRMPELENLIVHLRFESLPEVLDSRDGRDWAEAVNVAVREISKTGRGWKRVLLTDGIKWPTPTLVDAETLAALLEARDAKSFGSDDVVPQYGSAGPASVATKALWNGWTVGLV